MYISQNVFSIFITKGISHAINITDVLFVNNDCTFTFVIFIHNVCWGGHCSPDHLDYRLVHLRFHRPRRNACTRVSFLIDIQALDTQSMTSYRVGCFRFPEGVIGRSCLIHSCPCSLTRCLKGRLSYLSIDCTIDVQPPGMMTSSALHSSFAMSTLLCDMCMIAIHTRLLFLEDGSEPVMVFRSSHPPIH